MLCLYAYLGLDADMWICGLETGFYPAVVPVQTLNNTNGKLFQYSYFTI